MNDKTRKSSWGLGAAAIYGGFVLFILSLVLYASIQDVQLTEPGYYEQGLNYQQRLDRLNRSRNLEHGLSIEHNLADAQIVLTLNRPDAARASGTIIMSRPSNARMDRRWPLKLDASGRQVLTTEGMAPGQWRIEVDWQIDSLYNLNETRVVIP